MTANVTRLRGRLSPERDPSLPHQIVMTLAFAPGSTSHALAVSCNCLRKNQPQQGYEPIEIRALWETGEAQRVYRQHLAETRAAGPGMRPAILRLVAVNGTSEDTEWQRRDDAAVERFASAERELAAARADIDAYKGAISDGLLPALTTTSPGETCHDDDH